MSQCLNIATDEDSVESQQQNQEFTSQTGANLNGTFSKTTTTHSAESGCVMKQEPVWALVSPRGIVAILQLASVVFSQVEIGRRRLFASPS